MKTLLSLLFVVLTSATLFSQTDNLFWFVAPDVSSAHGTDPKNGAPINLQIVAAEATTVTVSQPANPGFAPIVFQLNVREHRSIRLDTCMTIDQIENYPVSLPLSPSNVQKKAFRITSEPGNIAVYYELDNSFNKELFSLKGRNAMGKYFFVSTQNQFPNGDYSGTAYSGFVIGATENNTRIVVYPNDDWYYFDTEPGDSVVLILNAGETFAFRAATTAANRHINGVPVKSDKDIVITFYDDSIRKKNSNNSNCTSNLSYDIIGDQLIPVSHTGKEYIIVRGMVTNAVLCPEDGGERFFITSIEPNTEIRINGQIVATMTMGGQVFSYPVASDTVHVMASKPVYVIHLTGYGGELGGAVVPSVDNCYGSRQMTFMRAPNVTDYFMINLLARNITAPNHVKSINAFSILNDNGWVSIPDYYFDYILDSTWIAYKKTPEAIHFLAENITCGSAVVIKNLVTDFHLGMVCGGQSSGVKYGYLSDFSSKTPDPVLQANDSLPVVISSRIFDEEYNQDEWLFLKITELETNRVWYDTNAVVTKAYGFRDTLYLDSGTYKCEILDMGDNVAMPEIQVDGNHIVPWGQPVPECYLFTIPGDYSTAHTLWTNACDSLVSPSGKYTWFTDGTYYDTIPNAEGYDSLLTVNLNIVNSTSSLLNETACFSYTSPAGNVIENSGTYHEIIPNAAGCDSLITLNLTIVKVDATVETIAGTLKAMEEDASYQWLACGSGLDIGGANEQLYTPITTGIYAVRITKDGCTVTSACNPITGFDRQLAENMLTFYPNPVAGELFIELTEDYSSIGIFIDDLTGRRVLTTEYAHDRRMRIDMGELNPGVYFVKITADGKETSFKIVKAP